MNNQVRKTYRYIIIGAGPAGLQLAEYFESRKESYIVLERSTGPGAFFERFPRHRKLISINKVHTRDDSPERKLRHDWNSLLSNRVSIKLKDYSKDYFPNADDYVAYLREFVKETNLRIAYESNVTSITKEGGQFVIKCSDATEWQSSVLICATGLFQPYIPPISGIEHAVTYPEMDVDPDTFSNLRVLIIGKGNSAFETADNLISHAAMIHIASPNSVKLAWKTHYVGHLRAVNNNFLDTYQLKSQNAVLDAEILSITRVNDAFEVKFSYSHADSEVETITYDRVLACTGFRFDEKVFTENLVPELTLLNRLPKQKSNWESTNISHLFYAGTLMQSRDYKKTMSGFIHGFRYNTEILGQILSYVYSGQELPYETCRTNTILALIIKRINESSALWQQPSFLCDPVNLDEPTHCRYFRGFPVEFVADHISIFGKRRIQTTLEYGPQTKGDIFAADRIARYRLEESERSAFLHPVVRVFDGQDIIGEHHVIEDLLTQWDEEENHIQPLAMFLGKFVEGFQAERAYKEVKSLVRL